MKADLHVHCGGAIQASTIHDIIKHHEPTTSITIEEIKTKLVPKPTEHTFQGFLRRFDILDRLFWDRWSIAYMLKQICWDLAANKIGYCELKFSLGRYVRDSKMSPEDIILFMSEIIGEESEKWEIKVNLQLALKYESDLEQQLRFSQVIRNPKVRNCVCGIDLVGDEAKFFGELSTNFYKPIFEEWGAAGKGLQAHVGESQTAENVRTAIEVLKVNRVAHGIKAVDYPDIMDLAKEKGVCFDIGISSNLCTGVIDSLINHPVRRIFDYGVPITIGTDDPIILNTNLDHEYQLLMDLNFTKDEILKIMDNSVYYAFDKYISCTSRRVQLANSIST